MAKKKKSNKQKEEKKKTSDAVIKVLNAHNTQDLRNAVEQMQHRQQGSQGGMD